MLHVEHILARQLFDFEVSNGCEVIVNGLIRGRGSSKGTTREPLVGSP